MKNYLKFAFLLATVIGSWQVNSLKDTKSVNALVLQNIEALASDEHEMSTVCIGSGSVDCPITHGGVKYVAQGYILK